MLQKKTQDAAGICVIDKTLDASQSDSEEGTREGLRQVVSQSGEGGLCDNQARRNRASRRKAPAVCAACSFLLLLLMTTDHTDDNNVSKYFVQVGRR